MSSTDVNVQLVINEMSKAKYESLLNAEPCQINDNELYFVKEENIDAENNTIINVADPALSSDAANKNYVDSKNIISYTNYISSGDLTYELSNTKLNVKGIVIGDQSNNDRYISLSTGGDLYIRNQSSGKNLQINLSNGTVISDSKIKYGTTPSFGSGDTLALVTKQYVDNTAIIKGPTVNVLGGSLNSTINIINRTGTTQFPIFRFNSLSTNHGNFNSAYYTDFYYNQICYKADPNSTVLSLAFTRNNPNSIVINSEISGISVLSSSITNIEQAFDFPDYMTLTCPDNVADNLDPIQGNIINLSTFTSETTVPTKIKVKTLKLQSANVAGSNNFAGQNNPIYAKIFECQLNSSNVVTAATYIDVSINSAINVLNSEMNYNFNNLILDTNKRYAITLNTKTTTDGIDTYTPYNCRMRVCKNTDTNDGNAYFTSVALTPEGNISSFTYNDKFAMWTVHTEIDCSNTIMDSKCDITLPEITNETPSNAAVTKQYVDDLVGSIQSILETI